MWQEGKKKGGEGGGKGGGKGGGFLEKDTKKEMWWPYLPREYDLVIICDRKQWGGRLKEKINRV